jgi:hypothetical protein
MTRTLVIKGRVYQKGSVPTIMHLENKMLDIRKTQRYIEITHDPLLFTAAQGVF